MAPRACVEGVAAAALLLDSGMLPIPLPEYAKRFALDDPQAFLAEHPYPALHVGGLPHYQRLPSGISEFTTRINPGATPEDPTEVGTVLPLTKDRGDSAGAMITLGRTGNNDLVLADDRVSKLHGYFQDQGQGWTYTDAGSTNGTLVDGAPVSALRQHLLEPGATLALSGEVVLVYLTPSQLLRVLRSVTE